MKRYLLAVVALLGLLAATPATTVAAEVAGVKFDDTLKVGNSELLVNGVGLRKKAFFKVYAMALYLSERKSDSDGVLAAPAPKRIAITLLRDLKAQQFVDGLKEGLADNHSPAELAQLKERIDQLAEAMLGIGEARSGTQVLLDLRPDGKTRLTVDGTVRGKDIDGDDFYRALLKIWLGGKPVQDDLKAALLGKNA